MSNNAFVTTRRTIDPSVIRAVFDRLNETKFKGVLTFDTEHYEDGDMWIIECPHHAENGIVDGYYVRRNCWLESKRKFAISHGGGGSFAWWVDISITNELALEYDGTISDEGVSERWKGEKDYTPTYPDFLRKHFAHYEHTPSVLRYCISAEIDICPPAFRDDLRDMLRTMIDAEQTALSQPPSSSECNPSN